MSPTKNLPKQKRAEEAIKELNYYFDREGIAEKEVKTFIDRVINQTDRDPQC